MAGERQYPIGQRIVEPCQRDQQTQSQNRARCRVTDGRYGQDHARHDAARQPDGIDQKEGRQHRHTSSDATDGDCIEQRTDQARRQPAIRCAQGVVAQNQHGENKTGQNWQQASSGGQICPQSS